MAHRNRWFMMIFVSKNCDFPVCKWLSYLKLNTSLELPKGPQTRHHFRSKLLQLWAPCLALVRELEKPGRSLEILVRCCLSSCILTCYHYWQVIIMQILVGGWPTPLKNMTSSVGIMKFTSLNGKSYKIPWFQSPPTRIISSYSHCCWFIAY